MVTFVTKKDDTALLRVICCNDSKTMTAINGLDIVNIDDVMNDLNSDLKIKHVNLAVNYADNENRVLNALKKYQEKKQSDKSHCDNPPEQKNPKKETSHPEIKKDFMCPECGAPNSALCDSNGKMYPCISCMYIDVAKKLTEKFGKEFVQALEQQNMLLNVLKQEKEKECRHD